MDKSPQILITAKKTKIHIFTGFDLIHTGFAAKRCAGAGKLPESHADNCRIYAKKRFNLCAVV